MNKGTQALVAEAQKIADGGVIRLECDCGAQRHFAAKPVSIEDALRAGWTWSGGEIRCKSCRSAWLQKPEKRETA